MQEVQVHVPVSDQQAAQAQTDKAYMYIGEDGLPRTCPVPREPQRVEKANVTLDITPLDALPSDPKSEEEVQPDAALTIRNFQGVDIGTITITGLSELDPSVLKGKAPHTWLMDRVKRLKTYTFTSDRTNEKSSLVTPTKFGSLLQELSDNGAKLRSFQMENNAEKIATHYRNRLTRRIYRKATEPTDNPVQWSTLVHCDGSDAERQKDTDVRDASSRLANQPPHDECDLAGYSFSVDTDFPDSPQALQAKRQDCLQWSVVSETPTWSFMREFAKVYEIDRLTQRMIVQPQDKDALFRQSGDIYYLRTYGSKISPRDSKLIEIAPVHFLIHKDGVVTFADKSVNSFQAEHWQLTQNSSLSECVDVLELFGYIFDAVHESNAQTLGALSRQLGKYYAEDDRQLRENGLTEIDTILASAQALRSAISPSERLAISLTANDLKDVTVNSKDRVISRIADRISNLGTASSTIQGDGKHLLEDIRTMHDQRTAKAAEAARKNSEFLDMCAKACLPYVGAIGVFSWSPLANIIPQGTQDIIVASSLIVSAYFVGQYAVRRLRNEVFS